MDFRDSFIFSLLFNILIPSRGMENKSWCITNFEESGEYQHRAIYCSHGDIPMITKIRTRWRPYCSAHKYDDHQWWCFPPLNNVVCHGSTCTLNVKLRRKPDPHCDNNIYVEYLCEGGNNNFDPGTSISPTKEYKSFYRGNSITPTTANKSERDDKKPDASSTIAVAATVISCILVLGLVIFIAVGIYRRHKLGFAEVFTASRELRRRPEVEQNIYSATHSGIDMPPPYPAPGLPDVIESVDRSIIGMRLPAIPPSEIDDVDGVTSSQTNEHTNLMNRDSATLRDTSPVSQEVESNKTLEYVNTTENGSATLSVRDTSPVSQDDESNKIHEYVNTIDNGSANLFLRDTSPVSQDGESNKTHEYVNTIENDSATLLPRENSPSPKLNKTRDYINIMENGSVAFLSSDIIPSPKLKKTCQHLTLPPLRNKSRPSLHRAQDVVLPIPTASNSDSDESDVSSSEDVTEHWYRKL